VNRLGRRVRLVMTLSALLVGVVERARAGTPAAAPASVSTVKPAPPPTARPPRLAWVPPSTLRTVRLGAPDANAHIRMVDADAAVLLAPGIALLVPAQPGDFLRVEGADVELGLGSGVLELPDVVTWLPQEPGTIHELMIPTWGSTRELVVRARPGRTATVRVLTSSPLRRPMRHYRADEAVERMIWEGAVPPAFVGELEEDAAELRRLLAVRTLLGTTAETEAGRAFLQAEWLEASARERPMDAPFVKPVPILVNGGRVPTEDDLSSLDPALEHRRIDPGERIIVTSERASVISLLVRLRAVGRSLVRVYEGDTLRETIVVEIPRQAENPKRWAPSQFARLVVGQDASLRVEVERGNALISLRGYRLRTSVLDRRRIRDREELLDRSSRLSPPGPAGAPLRAMVAFARTRSRADAVALLRFPGAATGVRALLLEQVARHPPTEAEGLAALTGLFALTSTLPAEVALPLRRSGLHAAWRAGFTVPRGTLAARSAPVPSDLGGAEDALVVEATQEIVTLPRDGKRPSVSRRVDRLLVGDAPRDDIERLARASWRTTAPWTWVDPVEELGMVIRLQPLYDRLPNEQCEADTPDGLRWVLIDRTPLDLTLAPGPGSHVRVPVRSEVETARPETQLLVDDVGVAVHTGAALTSVVAVKPGRHRFAVESGSPVLMRAPVAETLPCGRLREVERWVRVEKTAHFRLPEPGVASGVSILVEPDSMQGRKRELAVRVGADRHHGWFHAGATGALEVPVPSAADELELTVDRPSLLRVRLRLHPRPVSARIVRPSSLEPPKDAAEMLEAVRAATRYLRIALDAEGRRTLRVARAKALDALGYTRLAALDRARAGVLEEPPVEDESPDYVELPETSPAVVPLGTFAKIAPLPLPSPGQTLDLTLAAKSRGEAPPALLAVLGASADQSSSADALLLADLAERTGAIRPAALAYRRIGERHDSGEALSRAATLYTDVALAEEDKNLGLEAYLLARRAEEHGASAGAALGRLDAAIAWQRVQAGSAAGVARLEEARVRGGEPTPGEAVRSALLDAPPLARLFGGTELRLGVELVKAQAIELESTCHAIEGPDEPCDYRVELDGDRTECVPVDPVSTADGVTRPKRCRVKLPLGARGLRVIAPATESIGTIDAHRIDDGDPVPLTVISTWDEALPERPVRFSLLGPTVLRLTARGYVGNLATVVSRIRRVAPGEEYREERFELDPTLDGFAERVEGHGKVTRARTVFVSVPGTGPHEVALSGTARVLLRVERANAVGLPAKKRAAAAAAAEAPPDAPRVASERLPLPAIGFDPEPGPLTVGGYALALSGELVEGDADQGATYVELGGQVKRAIVPGRLWALAGPFGRFRAGPTSFGARAAVHFQHDGLVPGAFARGRYLFQDTRGTVHQGYYAGFGLFNAVDLSSELELAPRVAVTLRGTDERARFRGVDPDVYTRYAAEHPWSVDVSAALTHRLALDALIRGTATARLLPDFEGVDWVDLSLLGLAAPGRNHAPEARLQLSASYRPENLFRTERYVRLLIEPAVFLWHYEGATRLSGGAAFGYAHDFPENGHGNAFAFQLLFAGDYTFGRGLDDLSPSELVFRPRAEEGADVPARAAPRQNPYAAEPQR
jgi:hypothetical protein